MLAKRSSLMDVGFGSVPSSRFLRFHTFPIAGFPGVYTDVLFYSDWIWQTIEEEGDV